MYSNLKTTILGDYVKIVSIDLKTTTDSNIVRTYDVNQNKIKNNLIRAKTVITDIALSNNFSYYFTVTFNCKYDRFSLSSVYNSFKRALRKLKDITSDKIDYLVVPEQHKNGAWHFHGFFNSTIEPFIFVNKHLHLDIMYLCDLGFVNVQPIKDKVRISHYISKYIQKNLGNSISLYNHCYYCSSGLNRGVDDIDRVYDNELFNNTFFDFKSDYCFKKIIPLSEYYKIRPFLTKM